MKNIDTKSFKNILVIQTAFIGDAILTLPMIQILKHNFLNASIDVVVVPKATDIFTNHPSIRKIYAYDKRGKDKGLSGLLNLIAKLSLNKYDLVITPHRSIRSALLTFFLKPKLSIGFDKSAGRFLFKKVVHYNQSDHEIDRNISLLNPFNIHISKTKKELPLLFPSTSDRDVVEHILSNNGISKKDKIVGIAPGTIWNTKRWLPEYFAEVSSFLSKNNCFVVLLGAKEDFGLCEQIKTEAKSNNIVNTAGLLTLLQSAEMVSRCLVLISNDSAPMHLGISVLTPVIAIYGATVPAFGFAPLGPKDIVMELNGLKCRPCSIHGGKTCPIKTFDCMKKLTPQMLIEKLSLFI